MNSNQLKQFIAIAEEENITHASQKLFMSQSALSNTLKLLEEELGVELLLFLVPFGHPYREKDSISISELDGADFLSFENEFDFRWQDYLAMSKGNGIEYYAELPRGYTRNHDISDFAGTCYLL